MNTTFLALGISAILALGFLVSIGAFSMLLGAFNTYFDKQKLTVLKSKNGKTGFAFFFKWNGAKDPASLNIFRFRLFNPFGKPEQLEISRKLDGLEDHFVIDLDLGNDFLKFVENKNLGNASVQIELIDDRSGVNFQIDMQATTLLAQIQNAKQFTEEINLSKSSSKVYFHTVEKSHIADPIPRTGRALKLATNPEFAGDFAAAGGGDTAGAGVQNFTVAKVWVEPGCIVCNACEGVYPEVFKVNEKTSVVIAGAPMNDGLKMQEAAQACPVEVIKFTRA